MVTAEGIQAILAAADEAGLIGESRTYDNSTIADAETTVFTVQARGTVTRVAAYALGYGDDPNRPPAERQALADLQRFSAAVSGLRPLLPPSAIRREGQFYTFERLQVVAQVRDALPPPDPSDPTQNQPEIAWPLSTPLAAYAPLDVPGTSPSPRCGVLDGDDLTAFLPVAETANTLTPWVSEGEAYLVSLRPLLPDEQGCPPRSEVAATPVA